jgi:phosphoglycolate phosphatase
VLNKETMIENILLKENIKDKSKVVMIGDREHDLGAAKNVGVQAVGVLYGFGNKEELEKCHPKCLVTTVAELHQVLHEL